MSTEREWDVIVIGSGLGGLSSGAYLAATGKRVLVLEQYSVIGGSTHVFRRQGKWEFDVGVHYIGDCGPGGNVPTILEGIGVADRIEWLPLERHGFDTIVAPDFELKIPHGWNEYLHNLIRAFPAEEKQLRRYVGIMRSLAEGIDRSETPASTTGAVKSAAKWGPAGVWAMVPHARLMAWCGLTPRTQLVLSLEDAAMATTAQKAPSVLIAGFLGNYVGKGAWFPRGGGQMLSAAFAEVIRANGGDIRTKVSVERIDVDDQRVRAVRLVGGETITVPVVVSAIDIKRTYRDLVGYEHLPTSLRRRNDRWKMALPLINGYFGAEIDLTDTPNSNVFAIPERTWKEADSLSYIAAVTNELAYGMGQSDPREWSERFALMIPAYVQSSTRRDPSNRFSAPAGHSALEAQTLAPFNPRLWGLTDEDLSSGAYRSRPEYRHVKEVVTAGLLDRVEQAHPGASANLRWSELATPATQERFTRTTEGNSYGLEPRVSQFGPFRPRSTTPIKGLFLAGTSTAWGPATEGAMLSGVHAASAITGRNLWREIRSGTVLGDLRALPTWPNDFDPLQACRGLGRQGSIAPEAEDEETPDPVAIYGDRKEKVNA